MFNRDALFGGRGQQAPPPPPASQRFPPQRSIPSREQQPSHQYHAETKQPSYGREAHSGRQMMPMKAIDTSYTFGNLCAVNPQDFPYLGQQNPYLIVNNQFVVTAQPNPQIPPGYISISDAQRTWMQIALTDTLVVAPHDHSSAGPKSFLGTLDIEVGFAGKKSTPEPYDQDELAAAFVHTYRNQIFAPGQQLLMDYKAIPLRMTIKTVVLVDLVSLNAANDEAQQSNPNARGLLTSETTINYFKDAKTQINLRGSNRRQPAHQIVRPDFKFEDMGIGGLDEEFSAIFRRAFASRLLPPAILQKLGIDHVRGLLLYGPPGTGKTLIARQIAKMLNTREPKIVNGPEVLNKYVGQSEENIRKLFAEAEKEQKEKGEDSGLHIIIFDELDAVCKQRGSGAGGGTGVGDSVVNQLLSKLDGVEQLNNLLLIGMTNRKDMIDEALLRPGRLEVHMEISLPDEAGRQQILKIHTNKMAKNGSLADDVDISELAKLTRNFSGAEINGLVKAASSLATQRHIKAGTMAAVDLSNIDNMKVERRDFLGALEEVKAAFGVNDEELERAIDGGIIMFSPHIESILTLGGSFVRQIQSGATPLLSVLVHGPPGAGKSAIAARIAIDSKFPFIKLVRPVDMIGMNELQRIQYLQKIFSDAYKSPLNILVLDKIELMIDWVPIGPRFSSAVLAAIKGLIKNKPPKGRPLLIMATTSERSVISQLQFGFDATIAVPYLNTQEELASVMRHSNVFSPDDIQRAIGEIEATTESKDIGVGIQQVLLAVQTAMQDDDVPLRFAERMIDAINEARQNV